MTAKIITFRGYTRLDLPAERVLQGALEADLEGVVILGFEKNGGFYAASSYADGGDVLWLMELLKKRLLEMETE